jgi:hypothetical protein
MRPRCRCRCESYSRVANTISNAHDLRKTRYYLCPIRFNRLVHPALRVTTTSITNMSSRMHGLQGSRRERNMGSKCPEKENLTQLPRASWNIKQIEDSLPKVFAQHGHDRCQRLQWSGKSFKAIIISVVVPTYQKWFRRRWSSHRRYAVVSPRTPSRILQFSSCCASCGGSLDNGYNVSMPNACR